MRPSTLISILAVLTTTALASPALHSTHYTKEGSPTTKLAARHGHFGSNKVIPTSHPKRQIRNADYGSSANTIPAAGGSSTITAPKSENTSRVGIRAYGRAIVGDLENGTALQEENEMESTEDQIEPASVKGLIDNNNNSSAPSGVKRMFFK
jgi:hypothetical protein